MIGKFTDELIQNLIFEFNKEENKEKIRTNIIDPITCYIINKLYPYIFITFSIIIILLLVVFSILFLIIKVNYL